MSDYGHEHELVSEDYDDTDPDTCERCHEERPCEDVPSHGYSLHLCKACHRCEPQTHDETIADETFNVRNGIIVDPGRFEGEPRYVPHYWDIYLNGFADRDDGKVLGFDVTPDDKKRFPELERRRTVKLYQRDDGFVCEV